MAKFISNVNKYIFIFILVFLISALVVTQIITLDRPWLATLFFFISFLIVLWNQKNVLNRVFRNLSPVKTAFLLCVSVAMHVSVWYFVTTYLQKPAWPFSESGVSFLLLNDYFVFAIPMNVLFQQTLIASLVLRLIEEKLHLRRISVLLAIIFGAAHIFQVYRIDITIGLLFTFGAVMMSMMLPSLLIKKEYGFIYNCMIHLAIYDLAALLAYAIY